jgi:hypothetical protein
VGIFHKLNSFILLILRNSDQNDTMRSHGRRKLIREHAEVFLPPKVAHALLAGNS